MKKPKRSKPVLLPFTNNKGEVVHLDQRLTMAELVKAGIKLEIQPRNAPLRDGWYAHKP